MNLTAQPTVPDARKIPVQISDTGEQHLIVLNASVLGENAVKRYALILASLGMTAIEHASEGRGIMEAFECEGVSAGGNDIEERKCALMSLVWTSIELRLLQQKERWIGHLRFVPYLSVRRNFGGLTLDDSSSHLP